MSTRVFIPQVPLKFDPNAPGGGAMVPKWDTLEAAKKFGRLIVLVDSSLSLSSRDDCVNCIRTGLADFGEKDLFLPMGSHYFMMLAAIIISNKVPTLRILEWSVRERQYRKTETSMDSLMLPIGGARR